MKALSIKQPWAWAIVQGYKPLENRRWNTKFRGRFLVHASLGFDHDGLKWMQAKTGLVLPEVAQFSRGGIVGSAELVDVVKDGDPFLKGPANLWFRGPFGFVLTGAQAQDRIPLSGKLGFFEVPNA